jgi:Ca2+-binding RTX toxin-like protein
LIAANLLGISGIEQISIANGNNAISVTLTDAVFTANGQALKIIDGSLTQGALTIDGSALTAANVLDVTANTSTGVNDSLVGGAGNDTFRFSTATGLETGDTVTGGAGTDTIILAATAAAVDAVLTNVRTVENITTTGTGNAINITVGASTMAASTTLTTNASAQSTSTGLLTYDGSLVALTTVVQNVTGTGANDAITGGAGNDIILGGAGTDAITGGLGIDNLSGGDGVDTFTVAANGAGFVGLTSAETVNGGAGTDVLTFAVGDVAVASTDLLGLSLIETITFQNVTNTSSITLTDAVYTANGVASLTISNVTATSGALTVAAGSLSAANSVKVDISKTDNSATAAIALGAGADTVTVDMQALDNTTTVITGSAGNDTLAIQANTGGGAITVVAGVTGFETVSFTTAAGTYSAVVNDANVASGITQTVDGSILTGTLAWDGALELDGQFNITTGSGIDALTGGAKNDTISAGSGADVITGGLGADQLTGGAGADTFVYALGASFVSTASNATLTDTITDWTSGTDKLQVALDYTGFLSSLTVDATIGTARASTSLIQDNLSGSRGQTIYDTTGSALYINVNADNLLTTADFKININPGSTATTTLAEGDINFVITGGSTTDTITAGGGADTIGGGAGADSITGGAGADALTGGTGADIITGGAGNDAIDVTAAADVDTVVFSAGTAATLTAVATANGLDTITGYAVANDLLDFAAIAAVTEGTTSNLNNAITTAVNQGLNVGDNVLVLDDSVAGLLAADATALAALTTAFTTVTSGNLLVVYAASDNGNARVALVTLTLGDISAAVDIAILVGIDVDNVTAAMFTMA